jgi:hypothetical protein
LQPELLRSIPNVSAGSLGEQLVQILHQPALATDRLEMSLSAMNRAHRSLLRHEHPLQLQKSLKSLFRLLSPQ